MKKLLLFLTVIIVVTVVSVGCQRAHLDAPDATPEVTPSESSMIKRVGRFTGDFGESYTVVLLDNGQTLRLKDAAFPRFSTLEAGDTLYYNGKKPIDSVPCN